MAMTPPRILVSFDSLQHLQQEFERNLRKGGAFAPGVAGLAERSPCQLVLVHPVTLAQLELVAEVVYVRAEEPGLGIGLHLLDFNPKSVADLTAFVNSAPLPPSESAKRLTPVSAPEPPTHLAPVSPPPPPASDLDDSNSADQTTPAEHKLAVSALHDRIRRLSLSEQIRLAREGGMAERVALERLFGKTVWEPILQNQRVTPPEVARIARMGSVPTPLLETIAGNAGWLSSGEVRRALLANPRLSEDCMLKVLRSVPKPELQLIASQTYYPPRIRKAARTLLNR